MEFSLWKTFDLLPEIISEYQIFPILSFQDLYLHIFVQNLCFLTKNEDLWHYLYNIMGKS